MKLCNSLKSLSWSSLLRRSAYRLRRRPRTWGGPWSGEVLEQRALLAANVNLSVVAGAITMSATDGGNHSIGVQRVSSTDVEFSAGLGSQITYLGLVHTSPFDVAIPVVLGVTVNLGTGNDTYSIHNLSTLGNITFNGNSAGERGADLNVFSDASNMFIGGSVIFNVGNQTGVPDPSQNVFTNGTGNLTIAGSILVTESGPAPDSTSVFTNSTGSLQVFGSVLIDQSGNSTGGKSVSLFAGGGSVTVSGLFRSIHTGNGTCSFSLFSNAAGNVSVGAVAISDSGDGAHSHSIFTNGTGNLSVALGISINDSGTGGHSDSLFTNSSGKLTVGAGVTLSDAGNGGHSESIFVNADGDLTIGLGLAVNDSGTGLHSFSLFDNGSGNLAIVGGVGLNDSGDGSHSESIFDDGAGNLAVGAGGIAVNDSGSGPHTDSVFNEGTGTFSILGNLALTGTTTANQIQQTVFTTGPGSLTVAGMIFLKSTTSGTGPVSSNEVFSDGGTVSAFGISIIDTGSQAQQNFVVSNAGTVAIGFGGVTINGSGSGFHDNRIAAGTAVGSAITIAGSVVVIDSATGTGNESLDIDGSTLIGGSLLVTMNGPEAIITMNDESGQGTVEVRGLFSATMTGSSPRILVADDEGSGASPVRFDSGVMLVGGFGAGAVFEYDPANVTTPFIVPIFFTVVVS